MVRDPQALQLRKGAQPVRKDLIASSLEEAQPGQAVALDRKGKVMSASRYRIQRGVAWAALGTLSVGIPVVYTALWGLSGALVGTGLCAWAFARLRYQLIVRRTFAQIIAGDHDQEQVLRGVIGAWLCPRSVRGAAHLNLGTCLAFKSQFSEAKQEYQNAIRRLPKRSIHAKIAHYALVRMQVNLGELKDAEQKLKELEPKPTAGPYLLTRHWSAELYLWHVAGQHPLDADQLHDRAIVALSISTASGLLALLAWAHYASGDEDQAWHLLGEALDRNAEDLVYLPRLKQWIDEHGAKARSNPED